MQNRVMNWGVALVALVLLSLLTFAIAFGVDAAGTGPDTPLKPTGEWIEVKPFQDTWYAFQYDFLPDQKCADDCAHKCRPQEGHEVGRDCVKDCSATCHVNHAKVDPMLIEMYANAKDGGAGFCVMTSEGVREWKDTGKYVCTGQGTKNEDLRSQLSWSGVLPGSATYYVVVQGTHVANRAPVSVMLKFSGNGYVP